MHWRQSIVSIQALDNSCYYGHKTSRKYAYIILIPLQGYTIIFLFLLKNIEWGYSLEPPRPGGSNEYHNLYFEQKYEKLHNVFI